MTITGQSIPPKAIVPLGEDIDAYRCLSCGRTFATNADAQTFRSSPPLECDGCPGSPDMQAVRYKAVSPGG